MDISVVLITKNEAHIIENTLKSLLPFFTDIIIVDSGSTDGTIAICKKFNTVIIETGWHGYGVNKNMGIAAAKNNWILSLDADEAIDNALKQSLMGLTLQNGAEVFEIKFIVTNGSGLANGGSIAIYVCLTAKMLPGIM